MPHKDGSNHMRKKVEHHHRKVKRQHVPTPSTGMLSEYRGSLRFVERFRNVYAGREIWILATGPSLDDILDDFLVVDETIPPDENGNRVPKVSIAVKEAAIPFPNCTYNLWAFRDYALRHKYLPRGIIPATFSKFIFSIRKMDAENYFGKQASRATFMRFSQKGTIAKLQATCDSIIAETSSVYCGIGTIMHLAIEVAVVMGASKVSLVGCDHEMVGGKVRAQNRGISAGYGWDGQDTGGYEIMKVGTNFLANYFKKHNVEIVRYYHGRGYGAIVMEV